MIDADKLGDFLRRSRRFGSSISFPGHFPRSCRHFEKSCDKIAQPDWLTLVAIRSDERKKSRERAPAIQKNRGNGKSPSLHRAHLAILADRRDRRIKSPGVSPALHDHSDNSLYCFELFPGNFIVRFSALSARVRTVGRFFMDYVERYQRIPALRVPLPFWDPLGFKIRSVTRQTLTREWIPVNIFYFCVPSS